MVHRLEESLSIYRVISFFFAFSLVRWWDLRSGGIQETWRVIEKKIKDDPMVSERIPSRERRNQVSVRFEYHCHFLLLDRGVTVQFEDKEVGAGRDNCGLVGPV